RAHYAESRTFVKHMPTWIEMGQAQKDVMKETQLDNAGGKSGRKTDLISHINRNRN
ncbi:unnamed protein product, partial [Dovyalis caffra]